MLVIIILIDIFCQVIHHYYYSDYYKGLEPFNVQSLSRSGSVVLFSYSGHWVLFFFIICDVPPFAQYLLHSCLFLRGLPLLVLM